MERSLYSIKTRQQPKSKKKTKIPRNIEIVPNFVGKNF
jgi:hypothetical protein